MSSFCSWHNPETLWLQSGRRSRLWADPNASACQLGTTSIDCFTPAPVLIVFFPKFRLGKVGPGGGGWSGPIGAELEPNELKMVQDCNHKSVTTPDFCWLSLCSGSPWETGSQASVYSLTCPHGDLPPTSELADLSGNSFPGGPAGLALHHFLCFFFPFKDAEGFSCKMSGKGGGGHFGSKPWVGTSFLKTKGFFFFFLIFPSFFLLSLLRWRLLRWRGPIPGL